MGHTRLGNLPRTRKWVELLRLLEEGASLEDLAQKSLSAAGRRLSSAAGDEALVHVFWLLTQVPLAARKTDFRQALGDLGISAGPSLSILEITSGFAGAADAHVERIGRRSDLAEIAILSATESITALAAQTTGSLFGVPPDDVRRAIGALATQKRFGLLTREFAARFLTRFLAYHLARGTSNFVGAGKRFHNIREHAQFYEALQLHCRQASLIVQDFAGGWFSKTEYETGITHERASRFVRHAFSKIRKELERGGTTP